MVSIDAATAVAAASRSDSIGCVGAGNVQRYRWCVTSSARVMGVPWSVVSSVSLYLPLVTVCPVVVSIKKTYLFISFYRFVSPQGMAYSPTWKVQESNKDRHPEGWRIK